MSMRSRTLFAFVSFALSAALPAMSIADGGFCNRRLAAQDTSLSAQGTGTVLDFDGNGESEIVLSRRSSNQTLFRFLDISSGATREITLGAGRPVPGDYDGDGIWDPAVARATRRGIVWEWRNSSSGQVQTRRFGGVGDTILSGCRFVSSGKHSFAFVRNRRLFAGEIGGAASVRVGFKDLGSGDILGCGDPSGNGTDEPIFLTRGQTASSDVLATTGCRNEVLVYRNIRHFDSGLIAPRISPDFPLVVAIRRGGRSRSTVDVEAVAELFTLAKFSVPKRTLFSLGVFNQGGAPATFLVWQEQATRSLKRLALVDGGSTEPTTIGSAEAEFSIVGAQFVGKLR